MSDPTRRFLVRSGYGARTRRPIVFVTLGERNIRVTPGDARKMAPNLLGCAEAAERDGFPMAFARGRLGLDDDKAAQLLLMFRAARQGDDR